MMTIAELERHFLTSTQEAVSIERNLFLCTTIRRSEASACSVLSRYYNPMSGGLDRCCLLHRKPRDNKCL